MLLLVYRGGRWPGAPRTGAGQSAGGACGPGPHPPARALDLLALLLVTLRVAWGAVGATALPHAAALLHLGVAEGPAGAVRAAQGHVPQGHPQLLAALTAVLYRVGLQRVPVGGACSAPGASAPSAPHLCRGHLLSEAPWPACGAGAHVPARPSWGANPPAADQAAANGAAESAVSKRDRLISDSARAAGLRTPAQPFRLPSAPAAAPSCPSWPFLAIPCAGAPCIPERCPAQAGPAGRRRGSRTWRRCPRSCPGRR